MIYQSFKMAVKAIAGNKMRSFLTILGVVIGVVAIVVLVSIGQGANSSVVESIEGMGTNLITANINARRMNPIDLDSLNELAQNEAISYVAPIASVSGTVKAGTTTYDDGVVQGTTPGYESIRNWTVAEGRFLQQPDIDNRSFVAVIGSEGGHGDVRHHARRGRNLFTQRLYHHRGGRAGSGGLQRVGQQR